MLTFGSCRRLLATLLLAVCGLAAAVPEIVAQEATPQTTPTLDPGAFAVGLDAITRAARAGRAPRRS